MQLSAVVAALHATMQVSAEARRDGEEELSQMASHPGFAHALVHIACTEGLAAPEVRQLAALVLKHHVRAHWCEEADAFTSPCICEDEKTAVRASLPTGLRDTSPRIRTAISAAIACIATWDWPDQWPELLDTLLRPLEDAVRAATAARNWTADADAMCGSLRCLELCAGDLGEDHLGGALHRLLPLLLALYQQTDPLAARIRALAAVVARKLLERIATFSMDNELIGALEGEHLRLWAEALLSALIEPVADGSTSCNGRAPPYDVSIGSLRLLELLVAQFPMSVHPLGERLLPALGAQMSSVHAAHTIALTHPPAGVDSERLCDVDGNALGLEAHAAQLFDVFAAIALSSRLSTLLKPVLPELFFALLSFVRIPSVAQTLWEADLESYLQDEDADSFAVSTRVAAQQLMIELLDSTGRKALSPLCVAVERALAESELCRTRSSPASHSEAAHWWLWREAALVALSIGAELLCRASRRARREGSAPPLNIEELLSDSGPLLADLQPHMPPLLRGRALCAAARFSEGVCDEASLRPFLEAAVSALAPAEMPLLRACACRALSCFAARQPPISVLAEAAPVILKTVAALLSIGGEDATLLIVETITALLRHCSEDVLADVQAWLLPTLLSTWGTRWQDPLVSSALVDVFRGLARSSAALVCMVPILVPVLAQALQIAVDDSQARVQHHAQPQVCPADARGASAPEACEMEEEHAQDVEAAIDLIGMMLKRWPCAAALPDSISLVLLPVLLDLLRVSSDEEVLIRSAHCLCRFVRRGALRQAHESHLAAWHGTLRRLVQPDLAEQVRWVLALCPSSPEIMLVAGMSIHVFSRQSPVRIQVAACVPALLCDILEHAPALFGGEQLGSLLAAVVSWLRREARLGLTQQVLESWTLPNG